MILSELGYFWGQILGFCCLLLELPESYSLKWGNFFDFLGKVGGFELLLTLLVKSLTTTFYVLYLYFFCEIEL